MVVLDNGAFHWAQYLVVPRNVVLVFFSPYGSNLTDTNYLVHAEDPIGFGVTTIRNVPRLLGIKLGINL